MKHWVELLAVAKMQKLQLQDEEIAVLRKEVAEL